MEKENQYQAKIKSEGDELAIELLYPEKVSKEEEERTREYFQQLFSERVGFTVSKEEIKVSLKQGDTVQKTLMFIVKTDQPVYPGLSRIIKQALEFLIEELKKTKASPVVQYAIGELEKILTKKEEEK